MPRTRLPRRLRHGEEASLVEHLTELRARLVISLVSVGVFFVGTYVFRKTLIEWLRRPVPDDISLTTLSPGEPFTTSLNVALYAAIALALPVLIWQIWSFLAPAVEETHQRTVARLLIAATFLLACGIAFAYFVALPIILRFLLNFDDELYDTQLRASEYFSFAALLVLAFALLFELPIFVLGLVRIGILSADALRRNRRIAYGIALIGVVLMPGVDWTTMAVEALPVVALLELSILLAGFFERRWEAQERAWAEPTPDV